MLELKTILITDNIDQRCASHLSKIKDVKILTKPTLPKSELLQIINNVDCILVRSATEVDLDVISAGKCLKLIGRAGTGTDNIKVQDATDKGIIVMNTPSGNTLSAAELTCTLLLSMSRMIPQANASLKSNIWERSKFMGNEVFHKTLAIIGLGRIGREVSNRMRSFGMKTIGFDPLVTPEIAAKYDIEWLPLAKIWPVADYITIHTPLIPQTKNLINSDVFKLCKPTVKIINCARGGIISEKDLLSALNNGTCGGAALDVFNQEPPNFEASESDLCRLLKHPKVICTPHLGASTKEAQLRVADELALQIIALSKISQPSFSQLPASEQGDLIDEALIGIVNAPNLAYEFKTETKGWMKLARILGIMLGTIVEPLNQNYGKNCPIKLILSGSPDGKTQMAIVDSFLTGIMKAHTKNGHNIINAPGLLKRIHGVEPSDILIAHNPNPHEKEPTGNGLISIAATLVKHGGEISLQNWTQAQLETLKDTAQLCIEGKVVAALGEYPILTRWGSLSFWPSVLPLLDHPQRGILISKSAFFDGSNPAIREMLDNSGSKIILSGPGSLATTTDSWKFMMLDKRIGNIQNGCHASTGDASKHDGLYKGTLCLLSDNIPVYQF